MFNMYKNCAVHLIKTAIKGARRLIGNALCAIRNVKKMAF